VVLVNNNENEAKEKQQKHHKLKKLKDRKTLTFHGPKVNRTKMKMFGGRKGEHVVADWLHGMAANW